MKTKLQTLLLLLISLLWVMPTVTIKGDTAKPVISSSETTYSEGETPALRYYMESKKAAANSDVYSIASDLRGFNPTSLGGWKDPFLPGEDWSNPGNVGAPVGDASLPIILSILLIYLIYRKSSVSRRRNNF